MASNWETMKVFVTSYGKDFSKERKAIFKEVLADLQSWCQTKKIHLEITDIRWGGHMRKSDIEKIQKKIWECYFQSQMPIFINVTSDRLGKVPLWGDASEDVINEFKLKFKLSQSELEILFGAYREDNPNSIFVVRDDSFLNHAVDEEASYFAHLHCVPVSCRDFVAASFEKYADDRIVRFAYEKITFDRCRKVLNFSLPSSFSKQLLDLLKARISRETVCPGSDLGDAHDQMKDAQESFMASYSRKVRGRENELEQISNYVKTGGRNVPLLLLGGAGSGKTSILTKSVSTLALLLKENLIPCPNSENWHLFYHFVGAVPRSTDLELILKRLLKELDVVHHSPLRKDLCSTSQLCRSTLSKATTKPVIVVVDAVNQLDEEPTVNPISWLPKKLSPNIRVILSMINDTGQHKSLMSRDEKPQEVHITPLDFESRKEIATELLAGYHKLSRQQFNQLLAKRMSENPLWLTVACEELKLVPTSRKLGECIEELPDNLDLLENVLDRLERENGDRLLVATLCLLEVSRAGLLESELLEMLSDEDSLVPPSPFEEKDESERSEKECTEKLCRNKTKRLPEEKWKNVYRALKPFLRPYGDSREGRIDFYHRALSKAVRKKYFKQGDDVNTEDDESKEIYSFWHRKLADYFSSCDDLERRMEEYLYHLCKIEDHGRLIRCLCEWPVVDQLYNEEYSCQLLTYWRMVGGAGEMVEQYRAMLQQLEELEPRDERLIALRYEHVARIFLQSGKHAEGLELTEVAKKVEEKELGSRPERLVELYGLLAEIYDEKLKLNDFVSPTQLPDLRKTIDYGRKSIELRKTFNGDYHKYKLGLSIMKLAFSLESWEACGGDANMSGEQALAEGNAHVDSALSIFQSLKDDGHYAEALMTKGVLAPRGSEEQLRLYNQAMDICLQVYGEESLLTSRLYINIGIVYEDNKDFVKAYEFFKKWATVSKAVLGPDHPKTLRAVGVLKEPRYKLVALRLEQQQQHNAAQDNNESDSNNSAERISEASINQEVESIDELDIADSYDSLVDDVENVEGDFIAVREELQQAIAELFQRAMGPSGGDLDLSRLELLLGSSNLNASGNESGEEGGANDGDAASTDNRDASDSSSDSDSGCSQDGDNRDADNTRRNDSSEDNRYRDDASPNPPDHVT